MNFLETAGYISFEGIRLIVIRYVQGTFLVEVANGARK